MPYDTEHRDFVPASKTERLQPKFMTGHRAQATTGELAVRGPKGARIRSTGEPVYPNEGGRKARIGLSERFIKKGE